MVEVAIERIVFERLGGDYAGVLQHLDAIQQIVLELLGEWRVSACAPRPGKKQRFVEQARSERLVRFLQTIDQRPPFHRDSSGIFPYKGVRRGEPRCHIEGHMDPVAGFPDTMNFGILTGHRGN